MHEQPQSLKGGGHDGMVKATHMSLQSLYCLEGAATCAHEINATPPAVLGKMRYSAESMATLTNVVPNGMDLQVMLQPQMNVRQMSQQT